MRNAHLAMVLPALSGAIASLLVACSPAAEPEVAVEVPTQDGRPVAEAGYVGIGGIEQWITITGADNRNPVILFLHGGPGIAASPFAEAGLAGWEADFTLVQWDQRGAGRTFARNGEGEAATMSIERMVQDGIEVTEYLTRRLGQEKIIVTGGSWGSVLGIQMVHARPDLFHAYVGLSQGTNWRLDQAASYARVRDIARSRNDQAALAALDEVGPPPWSSPEELMPFRRLQLAYQQELVTAEPLSFSISDEYRADFESGAWQAASDFSSNHFFGPTLSGPLMTADVTALTDFEVPIFIIHGEEDLTAPRERVQAYFDTIRAPQKELHFVPGTGHEPSAAMVALQRDLLLNRVRPLAAR